MKSPRSNLLLYSHTFTYR